MCAPVYMPRYCNETQDVGPQPELNKIKIFTLGHQPTKNLQLRCRRHSPPIDTPTLNRVLTCVPSLCGNPSSGIKFAPRSAGCGSSACRRGRTSATTTAVAPLSMAIRAVENFNAEFELEEKVTVWCCCCVFVLATFVLVLPACVAPLVL